MTDSQPADQVDPSVDFKVRDVKDGGRGGSGAGPAQQLLMALVAVVVVALGIWVQTLRSEASNLRDEIDAHQTEADSLRGQLQAVCRDATERSMDLQGCEGIR